MRFVGSSAFSSLTLLFTRYETTWLTLTAITSDYLAALPATNVCVQESHASKRLLPRVADLSSPKKPDLLIKKSDSKYKMDNVLQKHSHRCNAIPNLQKHFLLPWLYCHTFVSSEIKRAFWVTLKFLQHFFRNWDSFLYITI